MQIKNAFLALCLILVFVSCGNKRGAPRQNTGHKVYIALGFHVNLRHSFRGDTNDEAGFAPDIRIIRKTINTLEKYNDMGVGVKAVWDFDNMFSLHKILPEFAPDIIDNIKTRVRIRGDEVILMSYNNALASALTEKEFTASIQKAISNENKSGVKDIFGRFGPIVRPQEMMTTPGDFRLYKKLGIEAVVLYHSAIAFDAIRTFIRPLPDYEAHNPLRYSNTETGESITLIPAYNTGDLIENGSLRLWASKLHKKQISGEIKGDTLIFINSDADDPYWYGYALPWYLSWLSNARGLDQLIGEVSTLDYIGFTTLSDYLENHGPVGEISFGQDTADGNFNGYNSWAEKSSSQKYWTKALDNRRTHRLIERIYKAGHIPAPRNVRKALDESVNERLKLLSTTNYGIAAPFLAKDRAKSVERIIKDMDNYSNRALSHALDVVYKLLDKPEVARRKYDENASSIAFYFLNGHADSARENGRFLTFNVAGKSIGENSNFKIISMFNEIITPYLIDISRDDKNIICKIRLYVPSNHPMSDGIYFLSPQSQKAADIKNTGGSAQASPTILRNEFITARFSKNGFAESVRYKGAAQLGNGSFTPYINYRTEEGVKRFSPSKFDITVESNGSNGVATLRLSADWPMGEVAGAKAGHVNYKLTLIKGVPYLFIESDISYPQTPMSDLFFGGHPSLSRMYDSRWLEAAPMELVLSHHASKASPFKILKRNYLGVDSSYKIDYFRHSVKNLSLADINNQITSEYVGVVAKGKGIAVAMDKTALASFAFCPMKMEYNNKKSIFSIRLNPFGSYFGPQYDQPTWGSGIGSEGALIVGPQYHSSAPTYNGFKQRFSLMVAFFNGQDIPAEIKSDLIAYANPPFVITDKEPTDKLKDTVTSPDVNENENKKTGKSKFKTGEQGALKWPRLPFMFKLKILFYGIFEKAYFFWMSQLT